MHKRFVAPFFLIFILACKNKTKNNGQILDYYSNGKIKSIKHYSNTSLDGTCFWFYSSGKPEKILTFINGEAEGHEYFFYESSALQSRRIYKNDKPVGYTENYFDHSISMLQSVFIFNDSGNLIYRRIYDTIGKVMKEEGQIGK